jgi:hypothetical protein
LAHEEHKVLDVHVSFAAKVKHGQLTGLDRAFNCGGAHAERLSNDSHWHQLTKEFFGPWKRWSRWRLQWHGATGAAQRSG